MSRRHSAEKRQIAPDAKFGSHSLAKLVNCLMRQGKKAVAESIVYGALERLESKIEGVKGIDIFYESIRNVQPNLEVRSRRVGGSTYQIPVEVREERRLTLALRWVIDASRARNEKSMAENLAAELFDAYNQRGTAVKKKEDTHKMAEANKAFAHYMW
ncbi:MAG: 30S ribosomal protein S7 [Candidatus Lambdaproteobacteria bacterium RIFOXYD1_FULL_56_27]|uniref:Small ribosomal subunit protein uS7 n=1 Tax=Candidatus Lambdaproteobacteria bacterium RIFOXYD2_FULL_56_26 TaxID=1817773 RepID=A0A1F6GML6_9PROT|nr:MAG: 30S ribosomal protein S7 [Candidatus Lambdaproteobacteria bacterium RIFOXYD2_FULL_56_26]OGH05647.1 MAG: 30S ribosomal protein S7 [Candidatus Lambdaproteobacteria bacterium RIFOXYC1_FULL_56_13]OGH08607.1 MAG: 30S ribosomal protein S7 [Candidatus Lambdaproteobacteria bacterium RIFOXYD1_FULL_56_27]